MENSENENRKTTDELNRKKEKTLSNKSILSQVLASSAQNLLLLDIGISVSFSTVIITALLNADGPLFFTKEQASWFGSVNFILQPIGSVASGFLIEPLGRKKSLFIVNIPHIVAWIMICFSQSISVLFCANALLGLGTGFMEAPIITYVAEISHPSIRGPLIVCSQIFISMGVFSAYLMGTILPWRLAAASFTIVPLLTFIAVYFIPESPVWLLSKKRHDDAIKALCWTRGWAKPHEVQKEFDELVLYQQNSTKCKHCEKSKTENTEITKCPHKNISFGQKIIKSYKMMTRKQMLRPFTLMILLFLFFNLTGLNAIKPNMINVYKTFGMNIDGHLATIITGAIGIATSIIMVFIVRRTGKRKLYLWSMFSVVFCLFFLGLYAYINLPSDASSYKPDQISGKDNSWVPTFLFIALNVCAGIGSNLIPWVMISEIFPLKGRGLACGISAGSVYIMNSVISKTFYNLETAFGLYGAMWFYCICTFLGFFIMYFILPETEGIPLADIEGNFSKKRIKIFADDPVTNFFRKQLKENYPTISTIDKESSAFRTNDITKF